MDEPVFFEVARSGIAWPDYEYRNSAWGGGAWGDYNADGWLDLGLPNHPSLTSYPPQMNDSAVMRNNGDGTFSNVIYDLGIKLQEDWHDIAWVDYDDDGDLDLWRTVGGRGGVGEAPSSLSRQNANGTFTEVAAEAGIEYGYGRGRGSVWFDYDGDGDLDMYFTGAESTVAPNTMFQNNGDGTFTNVGQLGTATFVGANSQASVADYDMDGDEDLLITGYSPRLYRNDGATFTDVSTSAGIRNVGGAQAAAWGDYDNDGDLDLYLTRGNAQMVDYAEVWDPPTNTELRFAAVAASGDQDGLEFTSAGPVTFELQRRVGGNIYRDNPVTLNPEDVSSDPGGDGFRVWQQPQGTFHVYWKNPGTLIVFSGIITAEEPLSDLVEVSFEVPAPISLPNRLYRNNGNGTFADVSTAAGVDDPQDCRGSDWGDFDNDGDLDLFVQTAGTAEANAPNRIYRNNGDGTFTDVAAATNLEGTDEGNGWGGSWGDYDNDGFLDLFTHQDSWSWPLDAGGYELHHSSGNGNHWLKLELQGQGFANGGSNRRGSGARVWISAGGSTQYRPLHDNSHYMYHYSGPIHVGLGSSTMVDQIRVLWPSGAEQFLYNVPADQMLTVVEGGTPPVNDPPSVDAGPDGTITLPDAAVLDGTVTDDGLPDPPGAVTSQWTQTSGPGVVSFGDAGAVDTTASFSLAGTYVLRLTANDGELIAYDEVTVVVEPETPVNDPPGVDAGPDGTITLPDAAALDGTVTDDGLPDPPGAVTSQWTQTSGPGVVSFGDAGAVDTTASFSLAGTYVLRLTANDGELSAYDEVTVVVEPETPVNDPPGVDAGPDGTITLPDAAALDGTVTDDGLPDPPGAVTSQWTKTSGPGVVSFGDAGAVDTTASFSLAGTYVLRLTADDGELSAYDEVTVVVQTSTPPNEIVIDNEDPEFSIVGSWGTGTWTSWQPYGDSLMYDTLRALGASATWTPSIEMGGQYEVFVWQMACTRFCAPNAAFTVHDADGSEIFTVDQSDTGLAGQWISLGVHTFQAGITGSVVLNDNSEGRVLADAVRLVFVSP